MRIIVLSNKFETLDSDIQSKTDKINNNIAFIPINKDDLNSLSFISKLPTAIVNDLKDGVITLGSYILTISNENLSYGMNFLFHKTFLLFGRRDFRTFVTFIIILPIYFFI
jgi:hypothetical protein